jgi:hypothetical protein
MLICLAWIAPCGASDALTGLLACRNLADATARLACFDREAAALAPNPKAAGSTAPAAPTAPAASIPAPAPPVASTVTAATPASVPAATAPAAAPAAAATPAPPSPALDPTQQFGLPEHSVVSQEVKAGLRAPDVSKIEAHLVRVEPGPEGRAQFVLDNDQVWRQLSPEGDLLARPGEPVTISRGLLRSYWLEAKSGRGCKVTRLR